MPPSPAKPIAEDLKELIRPHFTEVMVNALFEICAEAALLTLDDARKVFPQQAANEMQMMKDAVEKKLDGNCAPGFIILHIRRFPDQWAQFMKALHPRPPVPTDQITLVVLRQLNTAQAPPFPLVVNGALVQGVVTRMADTVMLSCCQLGCAAVKAIRAEGKIDVNPFKTHLIDKHGWVWPKQQLKRKIVDSLVTTDLPSSASSSSSPSLSQPPVLPSLPSDVSSQPLPDSAEAHLEDQIARMNREVESFLS